MIDNDSTTFVATDLEGTLFDGIVWEGMRDYLLEHGHQHAYRRFLRRQLPGMIAYRLGIGDPRAFRERWLLRFLKLFAGFSPEDFDAMSAAVMTERLWPNLRPELLAELRHHLQDGRSVLLVSGLFQPMLDTFTHKFAAENLPMRGMGTPLRFENGVYTGEIDGPLNVRQQKVERLQAVLAGRRLVAAYGDTRSDIPMLSLSEEAVAVYPDAELRQTAVARGWRILGEPP